MAKRTVDEIDWAPKPVLRPGLDYHDGVVYITIPLTRTLSKPGKGKDAEPILYKELQTYVITSERRGIWYDEASLDIAGFVPSPQVYQEQEPNWSLASAKAFLDGQADAPTTLDVFTEVRSVYESYVDFAEEMSYDLMALFVMYTYVFRLFESTGYVHFNGTAASGKSRNLAILNAIGFNTVWASNMSAASLYRKLAGSPGTTCIDESEGFEGERGEELRRILNAGYKHGATVIRTEKTSGDRYVPIPYAVFGPKALASINPLEPVIASRCVVVWMRPAIRELPDFEMSHPRWRDTRDRLYLWAMEHTHELAQLAQAWRDGRKAKLAPKLIGRQWETTSQFIILADYIGGDVLVRRVIEYFGGYFQKQQDALNATDRLRTTLRALPRVLAAKAPHPNLMYSTRDIHEIISNYLDADAKDFFKTKHVIKNLDTLGFTTKVRASGGVRIQLDEVRLRAEFNQRRLAPYDEDLEWLAGKVSYQHNGPPPDEEEKTPFWLQKEA